MKLDILHKIGWLAFIVAALLPVSCVNDDEPNCPPAEGDGRYVLSLRVVTRQAATRAAGDATEPAIPAENYIDIEGGDFRVLVFDGFGRLIQYFEPSDVLRDISVDGSYQMYTFSGPLFPVSQQIQVAVVANWKSMTDEAVYDKFILDNTFLTNIYTNSTAWNFTLPIDNWRPSIEATPRRTIPMFGCSGMVSLSDATVSGSGNDKRYDIRLGDINMLRAVAKIEVVDGLPDGYSLVEGTKLSVYNTTGRLVPDVTSNPGWNQPNIQVVSPTLPAGVQTGNDLSFFREQKTIGGVERTVYSAYVTEMAFVNDTRPTVDLTVSNDNDEAEQLAFSVPVDNYNGGRPEQTLGALLRNHIYRYTINSVNVTANLRLEVLPWDDAETEEWDYTDNVAIAGEGYLAWEGMQSFDKLTARMVVIPDGTPATGSFTISTPHNALWYAYLIPESGDPDAFMFVDADGNELDVPSGSIDGTTPAVIRVKPRETMVSQNNVARLQIMVYTAGHWLVADVCEGQPEYCTIIQNQN